MKLRHGHTKVHDIMLPFLFYMKFSIKKHIKQCYKNTYKQKRKVQQILDDISEWFPMSPGQQHDNRNENKRKYTNKCFALTSDDSVPWTKDCD